jgi:hypothetical protein
MPPLQGRKMAAMFDRLTRLQCSRADSNSIVRWLLKFRRALASADMRIDSETFPRTVIKCIRIRRWMQGLCQRGQVLVRPRPRRE